jgi:hypothetical protein
MPDKARRRFVLDTGPLRDSANFRRLWTGSSLSILGGQMTGFAVTLQVYRMTHSSAAVGAVGLATGAPLSSWGCSGARSPTRSTGVCSS